jgi:glycosyltransferase involved in cell wall biosynthesis
LDNPNFIKQGTISLKSAILQLRYIPMKILIVTPYIGRTYGGISKVVIEIASSLGQIGLSIDVVTTTADGTGNLDVETGRWIKQTGYRIRYFPTWHHNDFIISTALPFWLSRHLKEYDLVHTHTLFAPLITFTHSICRFHKIPYIITPHGMLEPWALSYKAWKKRAYYQSFERSAMFNASAIQVLAASEAKHVQALGNHQTIIVPNGIYPTDFSTPHNPEIFYQKFPKTRDKKLIIFLGRIDPKKGLDLLAPAFAKTQSYFPDAHLIVAGPDSINFLPTAQSYFAQSGCLQSVTFTGMLAGGLKQTALAVANIYVAPSYSEGFSISVLEGMASGLPCVITTACNFPEAAAAGAAYVVEANAQAIAAALIKCFRDEPAAKVLGSRAREFIFHNYTWDQAANKLQQAYTSILQPNIDLAK